MRIASLKISALVIFVTFVPTAAAFAAKLN
jgi:hypothetical protein